jgi:hypothetical protein
MRALLLAMILGAAGCAGEVGYTATVSSPGYAYGPDLVYAAPGVQVIADWNEPIFFTDGIYWRWDGFRWYRSTYYTGGWAYGTPPMAVVRLGRPYAYAHYRPAGWVPRDHRRQPAPPIVRDHRTPPSTYPATPRTRTNPPPPPPRTFPPPRDDKRDRDHRHY